MSKSKDFITSPGFFNQDQETLKQWYKDSVFQSLQEYLAQPNQYQNEKNEKHIGTVFLFDETFTSKYKSLEKFATSIGEAALFGTLGTDSNGNIAMWLQQDQPVGEFRVDPNDKGTTCTNTKIVKLSKNPLVDSRIHGYPVETLKGYQAYLLVEDLIKKNEETDNT